jgi:hypothetical protein
MENIEFKNDELKKQIEVKVKDMFSNMLFYLEIALPHKKDDGSENEKRFNTIRSKILRGGNDTIRSLDDVFRNYVVMPINKPTIISEDTVVFKFKQDKGGK